MAPISLQTSTGTRIRLHRTATIVEHQTGQESTLRYARLKTLYVANVARRGSGTSVHMLEAQDYSHPQSQGLHIKRRVTTSKIQQPQDYKSPDWVPMNRVNISDQHRLHSLRTLRSTRWMLKLIQEQDAM